MQLSYTSSVFAVSYGFSEISDSLATVEMQGALRLIFSSRDGNLLASQPLGAAPWPSAQGDIVYSAQFGSDFAHQTTASMQRLLNMSAFNAPLAMNSIGANGVPGGAQIVPTPTAPNITDARTAQVLEFGSGDWLALAQHNTGGLTLYQLSDAGGLSAPVTVADTAKTYTAGISDTATITRGADQILLTISALENGISSYRVTAGGNVEWIDSIGAQNGLAVNGLAMVQTVQIGGVDFALLAGTNSSSLTVLRVNAMGVFFETDHVIDTLDTRFARIAAFDGFVAEGRMFVAAAGTDAGLTLFELLPNGTLSHVQTFVLEGGVGLQAVTALDATPMGATVAISMVDAGADQLFRFDLDLGNLGGRIDAAGGLATGTGADERLLGSANADTVNGGGGDDFLHDGAGLDVLTGGAGADVFVFARDGAQEVITDFEDGIDQLDISAWGRIYTSSVLTITPTATGAEVVYGDERVSITSSTGTPLTSTLLTDSDFIF